MLLADKREKRINTRAIVNLKLGAKCFEFLLNPKHLIILDFYYFRVFDLILKIPAYRLGLSVDEHSRLERMFVDSRGYEPMDIMFSEDVWSVEGGCSVERSVGVGGVNPLFQVVFRSNGACRLKWSFTAELYGIVLLDGDTVEVDGGRRVYAPVYFHYDMVKRRCRRTITVVFKGPGECVFQLHMHRDFYQVNGFSGVAIVADSKAEDHYKFPIAFLTLGLVPKPKNELLRLMHKYYTPIVVLEEPIEESVEALKYLLENVPINAVVLPKDREDMLTSICPGLKGKRIIRYDAYADAYSEASRVYGELFGSEPSLEGAVEASGVEGWVKASTYAQLKNLKIADGVGEEFEKKTSEALFNLRVMLEEAIAKDDSPILSVNPPFKDLEEYCRKFSEDILGSVSPEKIYGEALSLLYKPRSLTLTVLDEPGLQVALTAAAYAVSRNTPLLTVKGLSREDKEAVEEHLRRFARAGIEVGGSVLFQYALHRALREVKDKDEAFERAWHETGMKLVYEIEKREVGAISEIMGRYVDPGKLKGYFYVSLFTEPQALYELLKADGSYLALDYAFGRLTGLKPTDALKLASSSTLTSINPPMKMNACSIGVGDEKDPVLDATIMAMATVPYSAFKTKPELGVEPKLYLKPIYHGDRLGELMDRLGKISWVKDVEADVQKSFSRIGKTLLEKSLKDFKLVFMYLHGGRDNMGFFLKLGRGSRLYDRDILSFKPFESEPFILLLACRAGMADINTNVGLATALISRGAIGVLANPVPIRVNTAHRFAMKMLTYLTIAGSASRAARRVSFVESLDPQHLLFILYGDPNQTIIPSHISSLERLKNILTSEFNTSENPLLKSLALGLNAKLDGFIAGLLERDKRLHQQPDWFIEYIRAIESYRKGGELSYEAALLTEYEREDFVRKAMELAEWAVDAFKDASKRLELLNKKLSHRFEAEALKAEASKTSYKASLSKLEAFRLMKAGGDKGLVKDKASEAKRLYMEASKLLIEAAEKCLASEDKHDQGMCLDDARVCEASALSMEAFISHIDGRLVDSGDKMLEGYLKLPKTEASLNEILVYLFSAFLAYALALRSGLGDGILRLKLRMADLLFGHNLLLKWLLERGYGLERVRASELCDDFKPSSEALKYLEELVEKAEEISITYKDDSFEYSLEDLETVYKVECCKSETYINTYVAYTYLILKELGLKLDEYSKPEALKLAWESLGLPVLEGFEKYLETWYMGFQNTFT
jgi:hypothetical protein